MLAQPRRGSLALNRSEYVAPAGSRIMIEAPPESFSFMRDAKVRTGQAVERMFPVAPNPAGDRMFIGIPLTTAPGQYRIAVSFTSAAGEERSTTVNVTVTPYAAPSANSATPPVVLLDGFQIASSLSGCPMANDSSGTFGQLQTLLGGAPNSVPNVYFFENCTECPGCAIEQLGADFATFLNSLPATQVDVVAHSMGGLIVRSYLSGKQTTSGVFNPPAAPKIRKAVFLATPQFGSFQVLNPLAGALIGDNAQAKEMIPASQFLWDLGTWNQFGDDLRGVDAVSVIGNAGSYNSLPRASDGLVELSEGSLDFSHTNRTRIVPYCHIALAGIEASFLGCSGPGIANVDSPSHASYQIISSFLLGNTAWMNVGTAPQQDPYLSKYGGMVLAVLSAADQYLNPGTVSFNGVSLIAGPTGSLFAADLINGIANFVLSGAPCGPFTEPAGIYSIVRCKTGPRLSSVGPQLGGLSRVVAAGAITLHGAGFGAEQCGMCSVTAGNANTALTIMSWSDTSIVASLPASFAGLVPLTVTTGSGSDTIPIMAAVAPPTYISAVQNSATGFQSAVAPGELVSIFGNGLGPTMGASFSVDPSTGLVGATLAGTQVMFGSYAAPLTYVSATQINAIVPYEVAGQPQLTVEVQFMGQSASKVVQVASTAPGAYSADLSGSGQLAVVNQDGTLNSVSNPAAKGSIISIYFTGGGQTSPVSVTGGITGSVLQYLTSAVSATVGGQPAMVTFDGSAPTFIEALDQLNIQLSPDTPSGSQPVVIVVDGNATPASGTIAVQ